MRRILATSVMTVALALASATPAAMANIFHRKHHSAEHKAAVKKCNEDFNAAMRDARTKKGADRRSAEAAARAAHKQCKASAPR